MNDYYNWDYDRDIICPYCGKRYASVYEMCIGDDSIDIYEDGKEQECTCEECGKRFSVTPELQWYYTTETIPGEMTKEEYEAMEQSKMGGKAKKKSCNTCKNNDDEFSGECYECLKGIFDHYEAESEADFPQAEDIEPTVERFKNTMDRFDDLLSDADMRGNTNAER